MRHLSVLYKITTLATRDTLLTRTLCAYFSACLSNNSDSQCFYLACFRCGVMAGYRGVAIEHLRITRRSRRVTQCLWANVKDNDGKSPSICASMCFGCDDGWSYLCVCTMSWQRTMAYFHNNWNTHHHCKKP